MHSYAIEPPPLLRREGASRGELLKGAVDALGRGQQRLPIIGRALDHRNDIRQRFVVMRLMSPAQGLDREAVGALQQLLTKVSQGRTAPVPRPVEQNPYGLDLALVLPHESFEGLEVIVGFVF